MILSIPLPIVKIVMTMKMTKFKNRCVTSQALSTAVLNFTTTKDPKR